MLAYSTSHTFFLSKLECFSLYSFFRAELSAARLLNSASRAVRSGVLVPVSISEISSVSGVSSREMSAEVVAVESITVFMIAAKQRNKIETELFLGSLNSIRMDDLP